MRFARGRVRALLLAFAALALVAGCSSAATPSPSTGGITVTGAWIRNSTASTGTLAAYFVITNGSTAGDTLLSASTPAAKTVQMHETVAADASMPAASSGMGGVSSAAPSTGMGGMGSAAPSTAMGSAAPSSGGMMTMVEVKSVDIPAGGTVEFKPGSYHLMLMDLVGTLTTGQTVDLTLVFAKAGSITVKAEVRAE